MRIHQHIIQAVNIKYPKSPDSMVAKVDSRRANEKQLARIEYEFRLEIYQKMRSQIHLINGHVRTSPLSEMPNLPWFQRHLWIEHNDQKTVQLLYSAFDKLKVVAQRQLDVIALKHRKQERIADSTYDRFEENLTSLLHFIKAANGEEFGLELILKASDIVSPSGQKERIAQVKHDLDWALADYLYVPPGAAKTGGFKFQCRRKMRGLGLPKRAAESSSYKTMMMAEYYGLMKPHYPKLRDYWFGILMNSSERAINRFLKMDSPILSIL